MKIICFASSICDVILAGKKIPPKKDNSFGGGGSGNDWWNNLWQPPNRNWILVGCAAGVLGMLSLYNSSLKEITWQEFRVKYLEQGEVSIIFF